MLQKNIIFVQDLQRYTFPNAIDSCEISIDEKCLNLRPIIKK